MFTQYCIAIRLKKIVRPIRAVAAVHHPHSEARFVRGCEERSVQDRSFGICFHAAAAPSEIKKAEKGWTT